MKIENIELLVIELPLVHPLETSYWRWEKTTHVIVKAQGEGLTGFGECACDVVPSFTSETVQTCLHILRDWVGPAILGRDWATLPDLERIFPRTRGHRMARGALEMAAWDLMAQAEKMPLCTLLGGKPRPVPVGVSVGIYSEGKQLLAAISEYLDKGYGRIKLKIKPGHDVEVVRSVRASFPDAQLSVDANGSFSIDDTEALRKLDAFSLDMLEQPLAYDDLIDHAHLQAQLSTSICLDESIRSAEDARKAIQIGACRVVNIKPGRVGGLSESIRVHDVCRESGTSVWCGGLMESGIGRAHNLSLATLPGFTKPSDLSESSHYYDEDLVEPAITMDSGHIHVPDISGRGFEINEERLKAATYHSETVH